MGEPIVVTNLEEVFNREDALKEFFSKEFGAYIVPVSLYKRISRVRLAVISLLKQDYIFVGEGVYAWTLSIMKRPLDEESVVDWEICYRVGLSKYAKVGDGL